MLPVLQVVTRTRCSELFDACPRPARTQTATGQKVKVWDGPYDKSGKGKGKGKQSGGDGATSLPPDCALKFGDNKPICGLYNRGKCWAKVKPGKRCQKGYHVCWRVNCNRHRPAHECTHTD